MRLATEEEAVAVVGAYQSAVALPAGEAAEELQTPFVVSTGAANEITERDFKYTFRLCPKAAWYARDQVRFLSERALSGTEPITKVALLHEDGEFGSETAADQREYLEEAGIEVVQEIKYPADQADFSEEVLQIKSGEAQAVLTATYLNDAVLIADSAEKLRLGIPILDAGGGTTDADFLNRAGNTSESIFTELEYCAGSSAAQLEKQYTGAHGGKLSAAALYSYQAVWLIANALERAASTEPERLRMALATTAMVPEDHMVLPQGVLSFDEDGQNRGSRLFVAQIQDLKYVPVWPTEYAQAAVSLP
jgi:branched-chain amino acid transport system substrate-binding protein